MTEYGAYCILGFFGGKKWIESKSSNVLYSIQNVFFLKYIFYQYSEHKTFESEWNWIRFLDFVKKIFVDCEKF